MKTMGAYHDLYLKSDILVFENFCKTCLQHYKLDPYDYFTSPGLSWDAMLKMTGIKLSLVYSPPSEWIMWELGVFPIF